MNTNLRLTILFFYILTVIFLYLGKVEILQAAGFVFFTFASLLLISASSNPGKSKFVAPTVYKGMKNVGMIDGPHYIYSTLTPNYQGESFIKLDGGVNITFITKLTASNPPELIYCYHVLDANGNHIWPPQE